MYKGTFPIWIFSQLCFNKIFFNCFSHLSSGCGRGCVRVRDHCVHVVFLFKGKPHASQVTRDEPVETDFGQTDFGHRYPTDFGQTDFGKVKVLDVWN